VWLDEGARRAVHLLKYDGWWRVADAMARAMTGAVSISPAATLVPIPLSAGRERTRGYNQSAVLAEAMAKRLGLSVVPVLARGRDTGTQTALTPEARRANLAGAFAVRATPPVNPVLVDDVFTTGATLAEAAQALLAAGAPRVSGVTFARAARPLADAVASLSSR
jgi:ComF family protein